MRKAQVPVAAAGILAAALLCLEAADPPAADDAARWTALDISASMTGDVICTPNEYWRCVELLQLGTGGRAVPKEVFGGHDLAGPWYPSLSYTLEGGNYPDYAKAETLKTPRIVPAGSGLPPSGRVGIYQLYMDELEHPRWALSTKQDHLRGRNVVQFNRPNNKPDARMEIPLPPPQQKRYARMNFLFAATDFPQGGVNNVRLLAVYADGTTEKLWQGKMSNVHGNAVLGRKKIRSAGSHRHGQCGRVERARRLFRYPEGKRRRPYRHDGIREAADTESRQGSDFAGHRECRREGTKELDGEPLRRQRLARRSLTTGKDCLCKKTRPRPSTVR